MLAEQTQGVNLNDYNDEDFIEVFYLFFRPWIKKHHGDEIGEYPMSHLIKEHIKEFLDDYKIDFSTSSYYTSTRLLSYVGKELIKKGAYKLKSLAKEGTFLDKYGKKINFFIEKFEFPDFLELKMNEQEPYNVNISLEVNDFDKLLKYRGDIQSWPKMKEEIKNFIQNYLGIEQGKPSLGKLNLTFDKNPNYLDYDDWVKNIFSKSIKKEIKGLPNVKDNLHSLKLRPAGEHDGRALGLLIHPTFKYHVGYSTTKVIAGIIQAFLESKGYNSNYIKVDI